MRVIAGKAKGRRLRAVEGSDKRPTTDRVKESIFSVMGEKVHDADVLDLFAGTGNLGIEALSRGARTALLVDKDRPASKIIGENLKLTSFLSQAEIWTCDVFAALSRLRSLSQRFDVIFADPPYGQGLGQKTLSTLEKSPVLKAQGLFVLEHPIGEDIRACGSPLKLINRKIYGQTAVHFFQHIDTEE